MTCSDVAITFMLAGTEKTSGNTGNKNACTQADRVERIDMVDVMTMRAPISSPKTEAIQMATETITFTWHIPFWAFMSLDEMMNLSEEYGLDVGNLTAEVALYPEMEEGEGFTSFSYGIKGYRRRFFSEMARIDRKDVLEKAIQVLLDALAGCDWDDALDETRYRRGMSCY